MSAYKELVQAIKEYNARCKEQWRKFCTDKCTETYGLECPDDCPEECRQECPDTYDMRWSVDVGIPENDCGGSGSGSGYCGPFWIADIQFLTWAGYKQGVIFYRQDGNTKNAIPETSDLIKKFTDFFERNK